MCGRADADGGSCGHQVPVDISKPVEATRPGSVTLPPLMAGPHQRRLDVLAIVATHLVGCSSATTPVINGALGRMSQDLGLTPYPEGYVTSPLLIGARDRSGALRPDQRRPRRPPGHGDRRTSLRPHPVTRSPWCGSW